MPAIILLLFIGVPIAEIAVFIQAGEWLGLWPTLGLVVLTAVAGTGLLRVQGLQTLARVRASLDRGEMPVGEVFTGLCLLVAGALLLTPGFITDTVGLLLFVPAVQRKLGGWILGALLRRGGVFVDGQRVDPPGKGPGGGFGSRPGRPPPGDGVVIEGDYAEIDEPVPPPHRQANDNRPRRGG